MGPHVVAHLHRLLMLMMLCLLMRASVKGLVVDLRGKVHRLWWSRERTRRLEAMLLLLLKQAQGMVDVQVGMTE